MSTLNEPALHKMIDTLHKEAERHLEIARQHIDGGTKENYTANMTAALILQSIAKMLMSTRETT